MKRRVQIFLLITAGIVGLFVFKLATYEAPLYDCLPTVGFIGEFGDLTVQQVARYETVGTISGIEISVKGQIRGSGILTIGYSDSTSYRDYTLDSGSVNISHISDWYSNICYLRFTSMQKTEGKLSIICDFIGD